MSGIFKHKIKSTIPKRPCRDPSR